MFESCRAHYLFGSFLSGYRDQRCTYRQADSFGEPAALGGKRDIQHRIQERVDLKLIASQVHRALASPESGHSPTHPHQRVERHHVWSQIVDRESSVA